MSKTIFLFPGQGAQHVGMGKDVCDSFSVAREVFEEAEDALKIQLKKMCFDGPESDLALTENTQPAILTMSIATHRVLRAESEIQPTVVAGHSLGEYSALVAADSISFLDAVRAVRERGKAMQEAVPVGKGAMAAFMGGTAEVVSALCEEVTQSFSDDNFVSPANFNGGGQIVVSGTTEAVKKSVELAKEKGIRRAVLLDVSAPFHCKLMQPAADRMTELFETTKFSKPSVPYIANVDAHVHDDEKGIRDRLIQQIPNPVLWEGSMNQLASLAIDRAVEIGPGKVLTGLLRRINKGIASVNIQNKDDIKGLSS